ncbi:MAG: anhydro-N-acetylmuramic acid kinase [Bacteroidales bacterium]|nr:anhydro-N-acetylmuramic acid kinase [Bacteroidales bacterium]
MTAFKRVIGLMSGTSLDGLDMVCCDFFETEKGYDFQIIASEELPYPAEITSSLREAFYWNQEQINLLDIAFGSFLAESTFNFIQKYQLHPQLIASHGHTIFHQPDKGLTLQIGDGQTIANTTGISVVNNFRQADVLKGGQGAPLVPLGDRLLFSDYDFCLNIGGIANISYELNGSRIAFDVCPANMVLNHLAAKKGLKYDKDGTLAALGKLDEMLWNQLNALDYYTQIPPKSLGREWVEKVFLPHICNSKISIEDLLQTCVTHIAHQVNEATRSFPKGKMLITGGGAFNTILVEKMKSAIHHQIIVPEDEIVSMKEAVVFALLGLLRVENKINCYKSVTGASSDSSTGDIYHPNNP